ncbi:MAG: hypothetical protein V4613_07250 [Bacteroidota bacterium]
MSTNCLKCEQPLLQGSQFCTQCGFDNEPIKAKPHHLLYIFLGGLLSFAISAAITGTGLYMLLAGISIRYSDNNDHIFDIAAMTFMVFLLHLLLVPLALSSWGHHNIRRGYNWGNAIFIGLFLIIIAGIYIIYIG